MAAVYHAMVIGNRDGVIHYHGALEYVSEWATRIFRRDSCQGDLDDLQSECRSNTVPTCREYPDFGTASKSLPSAVSLKHNRVVPISISPERGAHWVTEIKTC